MKNAIKVQAIHQILTLIDGLGVVPNNSIENKETRYQTKKLNYRPNKRLIILIIFSENITIFFIEFFVKLHI